MGDKSCVIVYGLDELASAVARHLLLSGYAVAMHAAAPPQVLRRRMALSDAWYDGSAALEGVEARRTNNDADLLTGLRSSMFIPVLAHPSFEAVGRWPWDVVIDARGLPAGGGRMGIDAELAIVLGHGAVAGRDCDIVIETGGMDPGAVVRSGSAATRPTPDPDAHVMHSPATGVFHADVTLGDVVDGGTILGYVGSEPLIAPVAGRLRGLARENSSVEAGAPLAEIATNPAATVDLIDRRHKLIARSVAFTVETELEGQAMNPWPGRPAPDEAP